MDKLFTFANSVAADYDFTVAPAVTGVSVDATGKVTVLNATTVATTANIKATHKTQTTVTATKAITITPKP